LIVVRFCSLFFGKAQAVPGETGGFHAAKQTIISAEKIIKQLKMRVSAAKKSLAGDGKPAARRVARRAPERTGKKRIKPVKARARRAAVHASSRARSMRKTARKAS
jgi:hypothetical protein